MNFEREASSFQIPIDQQIGTLLAFIILFEKKIETLRVKLSGNQQFHSRLAFQLFDSKRRNAIYPEDLIQLINRYLHPLSLGQAQLFCRRYTSNGMFSYDEFIKIITPKRNKVLAQRLMIRTYRNGTQLPSYVIKLLLQLMHTIVSMSSVTQNLRKNIQQSNELTHVELLQLFRKCMSSSQKLYSFINLSTKNGEEYDFLEQDMEYLCLHVRGNCELSDINDQQIKQLICPIDMNFKKTFYKTGQSLQTNKYHQTSYNKVKANENVDYGNRTMNFLKTNYKNTATNYQQKKPIISEQDMGPVDEEIYKREPVNMNIRASHHPNSQSINQSINNRQVEQNGYDYLSLFNMVPQNKHSEQPKNGLETSNVYNVNLNQPSNRYTNMYIDNFKRNPNNSGIDLDNYLVGKNKPKQRFVDDLNGSSISQNQSRGSAFVQY